MFIDFKHGEETTDDFDVDSATPFRYLIKGIGADGLLPVSEATVKALDDLGEAMVDPTNLDPDPTKVLPEPKPEQASGIPPIYTYWAQFLDHELTARTDREVAISTIDVSSDKLAPADRDDVQQMLLNRRTPAIELDCLYGDGLPGVHGIKTRLSKLRNFKLARQLRDGAKLRVGRNLVAEINGVPAGRVPPPLDDLQRDLPRIGQLLDLGVVTEEDFPKALRDLKFFRKRAFVGDPRNDENLVVAQFHTAMLRFHNAVVDQLQYRERRIDPPGHSDLFEDAQRIVRWTFQWLVVNDFMPTLLKKETVDAVVKSRAQGYFRGMGDNKEPYMPLEFSVACYRFGHSMIREFYDYNRNFGRPTRLENGKEVEDEAVSKGVILPNASLNLLFTFTGKSANPFGNEAAQSLPHNWIIEWHRFDGSAPLSLRHTRKIDSHMEAPLGALQNEPAGMASVLKMLAKRNLRRGYLLSLPSGQALASELDIPPLTDEQIESGNSPRATEALKKLRGHTPLWFYTLKEAEVLENGERLGPLGSRVVAETLIGVLLADSESYLVKQPNWNPSKPILGVGGPLKLKDGRTIQKIADLLEFAGVKPAGE